VTRHEVHPTRLLRHCWLLHSERYPAAHARGFPTSRGGGSTAAVFRPAVLANDQVRGMRHVRYRRQCADRGRHWLLLKGMRGGQNSSSLNAPPRSDGLLRNFFCIILRSLSVYGRWRERRSRRIPSEARLLRQSGQMVSEGWGLRQAKWLDALAKSRCFQFSRENNPNET